VLCGIPPNEHYPRYIKITLGNLNPVHANAVSTELAFPCASRTCGKDRRLIPAEIRFAKFAFAEPVQWPSMRASSSLCRRRRIGNAWPVARYPLTGHITDITESTRVTPSTAIAWHLKPIRSTSSSGSSASRSRPSSTKGRECLTAVADTALSGPRVARNHDRLERSGR
jgi:hypothetical protein